jgi:hypothetical protein
MTRRLLVLALTLFAAVPIRADSPHFIRATASLDRVGDLVVAWKEAGLGANQAITYTASANASATYQCVNHGGQCPSASNKQDVAGPVSSTGTFSSGKNGQITASLVVEPPATTLVCPGNQIVALAQVAYSDIALSDDTTPITAAVAPTAISVVFGVCP